MQPKRLFNIFCLETRAATQDVREQCTGTCQSASGPNGCDSPKVSALLRPQTAALHRPGPPGPSATVPGPRPPGGAGSGGRDHACHPDVPVPAAGSSLSPAPEHQPGRPHPLTTPSRPPPSLPRSAPLASPEVGATLVFRAAAVALGTWRSDPLWSLAHRKEETLLFSAATSGKVSCGSLPLWWKSGLPNPRLHCFYKYRSLSNSKEVLSKNLNCS